MLLSQRSVALFAAAFSAILAVGLPLSDRINVVTDGRTIELVNKSGKKLVVDWVNPKTGKMTTLQGDFQNGATTQFNTFINHTFAIHEPSEDPNSCGGETGDCKVSFVTINENDQQVVVVHRNLEVDYEDSSTHPHHEAGGMIEDCRDQAKDFLSRGLDANFVMEELAICLQEEAAELLKKKTDQIAFESQIRTQLSSKLENHTCADPTKTTTEPVEVRSWEHKGETRTVGILHDRPASQIHAIKNFISVEECDAITKTAQPLLHRGTVADGKGGSKLSEHRKAWQAGIEIPWEKEADGDLIARVMRRVYDYTNDAVGYNLTVEGQEDLMSIQYFGIGKESTESPDQYMPHCDGQCDGLTHKHGGRVATMVMYCEVPDLGGATNFQNSDVYVKPELGTAAFFSYMDPVTKLTENGFTTHSGCPVIEGTKRIAVHWMRIGVDEENPWDSFNTLTIKKDEEEDC